MHFGDRILVIDDQLDNRMILEELLGGEYTVRCVESGNEALRVAPHFKPNLVLLDVMMPGLSGNETCDLLRLDPGLKAAKIVMVSSLGEVRDRLAAYKVGAVDYITKPFNCEEVLAKVRAWMRMAYSQQVDEIWNEIETTRDAMGMALVKMASFRDTETGEHLVRVRCYSTSLAAQLATWGPYRRLIDKAFIDQIYRASPLHDIGKVGIGDSVLQKSGALSTDEFEAMKRHTSVGAEILAQAAAQMPHADYLKMAIEIARHHHERFDGSGYPAGLSGTDIPLAARIVAVADVLDALISRRVYKEAMSIAEAFPIIEDSAGSHFDPVVVNALQLRLDELLHPVSGNAEKVAAH